MSKFLLEAQAGQLHGKAVTTLVTVSGGPTLLPSVPLRGRKDFLVYNDDIDTVFIGGADVTAANGIPVPTGGSFGFQAGRVEIYALVSGTNQDVRVLEVS